MWYFFLAHSVYYIKSTMNYLCKTYAERKMKFSEQESWWRTRGAVKEAREMTWCMLSYEKTGDFSSNFRQVRCLHYWLRRRIMGRYCSFLGQQVLIFVWFCSRPCTWKSPLDTKLRPAPITSARKALRCVICVSIASFSMAPLFPHCHGGDNGNTPTPNSTKSLTSTHTHTHTHVTPSSTENKSCLVFYKRLKSIKGTWYALVHI